jgi:hypothetical protein
MQITCADADAPRFKELGFHIAEREGALVILEDHEANYAHDGNLPTDLLYAGHHGAGGNYEGGEFACNGQEFAFMPAGMDGGVIVVLRDDGTVSPDDLQRWLRYVAVRDKANAELDELRRQSEPEPVPIDLSSLLKQAADAAACDQWLSGKLHEAARSWVRSIEGGLPRELTDTEREQPIEAYKDGYFTPVSANTKP